MRIAVICTISLFAATARAAPGSCPSDTAIVVDSTSRTMALCAEGHAIRELPVALGRGGLGKQREGDRKTPLGSYALGAPRESSQFHLFIDVGYPTPAQRAGGQTGGDVGIHGPSRKQLALGLRGDQVDWTDGCIAVGTDTAIDAVASWVRSMKPRRVIIE